MSEIVENNAENASELQKLPSQIIFDNLKELVHAKNTAHESMFKFHWKKMWPFNMIWPQVDFNRIVRFMGEIATNCRNQKALVAQAQKKSQDFEKKFLNAVPAYLEALETSCDKLAAAAQWKQDWLERKAKGGAKLRRDVSEYNNLLKDYEKAQGDLVRAGAFVQMGWGEVVLALRDTSK